MWLTVGANSLLRTFNICDGTPSGPLAFFVFIPCSSFSTTSVSITRASMVGSSSQSKWGTFVGAYSLFRRVVIPKGHYSEKKTRVINPKGFYSEGSLFRNEHEDHYPEVSLFRKYFDGHYSEGSLFRK